MAKQDPNNYRKHSERNKELINKSLTKLGAGRSVLIDSEDYLIAGNGVMEQAEALGIPTRIIETDGSELVVVKRTDLKLGDAKRKELALADNATSDTSEWDVDALVDEWGEGELSEWDVNVEWPEEAEPYEDPGPPEVKAEAETVLGDLYELNGHRVLCDDCRDGGNIDKLMAGTLADLVFTDPPYGAKKESDGILNDNQNQDDLLDFNRGWFNAILPRISEKGSVYVFGYEEPLMDFYQFIFKPLRDDQKATFRNWITWDKGSGQGQNSPDFRSYARATESIIFFMMGVQGFNNNADNYFEGWEPIRKYLKKEADSLSLTSKTVKDIAGVGMYSHWFTKSQWVLIPEKHYKAIQAWAVDNNKDAFKREYDEIKREYDEIKREFYDTRGYFDNTHDNMNDVWHFTSPHGGDRHGHASPKPVKMIERGILSSCPLGGIVADVFLGSGTTLIASEETGRICYGTELAPNYCDVIVKRWIKYMKDQGKPFTVKRNGEDITKAEWLQPSE